jgi:ADP-ribose pyrophosphatase YjhB (NUDIX family)
MSEQGIEIIVRGVWMQDGQVLVCRDLENGHCFLPGGHVEFGETAAGALQREMVEELGLSLQVGRFLGAVESAFDQADGSGSITRHHEVNLVFELSSQDIDPADAAS